MTSQRAQAGGPVIAAAGGTPDVTHVDPDDAPRRRDHGRALCGNQEDELRHAAFGEALVGDRELAVAAAGPPRHRLLAAVLLGARGRYAAAATILTELARGREPVLAAHAGAALAAHRRQLGGHAAALPLDGAALRRAAACPAAADTAPDPDGLDAPGARADALLGLAADNLGLGRLPVARRLLAAAESAAPAGWRAEVRSGWVRAELELASGAPAAAVAPAERAAELAHARGAARHAVKSDLVLAAALTATGGAAARAKRLVAAALERAGKLELCSLAWPAGLLAAELDPERAGPHRSRVTRQLHAVLLRSDVQGRRLAQRSPWVPI